MKYLTQLNLFSEQIHDSLEQMLSKDNFARICYEFYRPCSYNALKFFGAYNFLFLNLVYLSMWDTINVVTTYRFYKAVKIWTSLDFYENQNSAPPSFQF